MAGRLRITASCIAVAVAAAKTAPAVYWRASPVAESQSTLYAGAFGPTPSVRLCSGPSGCASWTPVTLLDGWNHSVKFAYPSCDGPCRFQFCAATDGPCTDVPDPNSPDVWFTMAIPPLQGTTFSPSMTGSAAVLVNSAGLLRVVGRSLAFQATGEGGALECVFGGARQSVASTTLLLNASMAPVAAQSATCFEATFNLTSALAGIAPSTSFPGAVLQTPFGTYSFPVAVAPAAPAAPLTVIDVDAQAGGNVSAALAMASALPGYKLVSLGPHAYALSEPLAVPGQTVLAGQGAAASALVFTLPSAGPAPSGVITGSGSNWGLRDVALTLLDAPAKTPAVWMQPGSANFSALRVNVTMQQVCPRTVCARTAGCVPRALLAGQRL